MTRRTTLNRLRNWWLRTATPDELEEGGYCELSAWVYKRNHHPLPTIPDADYLRGPYIDEIRKSAPKLETRATRYINHYLERTGQEGIIVAGKERGR